MAKPTLLPDPTCKLLDASETVITAVVMTTSEDTECPLCHRRSARIHSRYVREVEEARQVPPWYAGRTKQQEEKSVLLHQERVERYHKIHELYANKVDVATIARQVGLSRQGVYNFLKMKQPPERTRINEPRKPLIEPYKDYLVKRWNEGCRNAQQVYRAIKEQGYTGSDQPIVRYFAQFRTQKDARKFKQVDPATQTPVKAPPQRPPTASQVAHWVTFKED